MDHHSETSDCNKKVPSVSLPLNIKANHHTDQKEVSSTCDVSLRRRRLIGRRSCLSFRKPSLTLSTKCSATHQHNQEEKQLNQPMKKRGEGSFSSGGGGNDGGGGNRTLPSTPRSSSGPIISDPMIPLLLSPPISRLSSLYHSFHPSIQDCGSGSTCSNGSNKRQARRQRKRRRRRRCFFPESSAEKSLRSRRKFHPKGDTDNFHEVDNDNSIEWQLASAVEQVNGLHLGDCGEVNNACGDCPNRAGCE